MLLACEVMPSHEAVQGPSLSEGLAVPTGRRAVSCMCGSNAKFVGSCMCASGAQRTVRMQPVHRILDMHVQKCAFKAEFVGSCMCTLDTHRTV